MQSQDSAQDNDNKQVFEDLYRGFFYLPHMPVEARRIAFEFAIENMPRFTLWEIVGITPAALEHLAAKDFSDFVGLHRSHNMSRKQRGRLMFDRHSPMENAFEFFFSNDVTIIATKEENARDNFDRSRVIPVRNSEFGRHITGISMTRKLRSYLLSLHVALGGLTDL